MVMIGVGAVLQHIGTVPVRTGIGITRRVLARRQWMPVVTGGTVVRAFIDYTNCGGNYNVASG